MEGGRLAASAHQSLHLLLPEPLLALPPVVLQEVVLVVANLCDAIFPLPSDRHPQVPTGELPLSTGALTGRSPSERAQAVGWAQPATEAALAGCQGLPERGRGAPCPTASRPQCQGEVLR